MFCDGGGRHVVMPHLEEVDALAKKGLGITCLHYGVEITKGEPGDYLKEWTGGYFETDWSVNPHWTAHIEIPSDGVPSKTPTLEELKENQDYPVRDNYDFGRIAELIEQWKTLASPPAE